MTKETDAEQLAEKDAIKIESLNQNRRRFLQMGGVAVGSLLGSGLITRAIAGACGGLTPPQAKGPFYPEPGISLDNDLTRIPGSSRQARGEVCYLVGKVTDEECRLVAGVNVEIWQACATGRYNHSRDPNTGAALDPDFRYWGETFTDDKGEYSFKTIRPGAYPANETWDRPPHIHFRVAKLGFRELVTQMYFRGEPLNGKDLILQELSSSEQARVVVDFRPSPAPFARSSVTGVFDITVQQPLSPK